jgi:superfamily II DNA or RNA helicase
MNTSIGKRGYTILKEELTSSQIYSIRQDLTVKAFVNQDYGAAPTPFPVYCESSRKLYLPRYYGIKHFGLPKSNKIEEGEKIFLDFPLTLKPKQLPIVEAYMKAATEVGGGIISVPCGYGKTVIGLYLASKLGLKTLVVVHKEFLVNQWKERIKQFLPNARIGKIQSNKIFVEGYDIVIGMLQSISMKEYSEDMFKDFGFVIYDECHHLGAETFSRALLKTGCKYTLGLSATPTRADGLTKVFQWHLGDIVYKINKREEENVKVKLIEYTAPTGNLCAVDEVYDKIVLNYLKKPNMAQMINNICAYFPRTKHIINETVECLKEGRKILILSDRREHLKTIKTELDKTEFTSGYYLGGMKEKDLEETEGKQVILGTFMMASEGFDCRYPLNTIILASPKSNIEQAVGRILRQDAKDQTFIPLVIDIMDSFSTFSGQCFKRIKFYQKNNYNIETYNTQNEKVANKFKKKKEKKVEKPIDEAGSDFLADSD